MTEISLLSRMPNVQSANAPPERVSNQIEETAARDKALREAAETLEAGFLSEMLKSAGLGKTSESFGGGTGEDQFSSFLRDAQAREMVKTGGIGLAESLYQALKERENDN